MELKLIKLVKVDIKKRESNFWRLFLFSTFLPRPSPLFFSPLSFCAESSRRSTADLFDVKAVLAVVVRAIFCRFRFFFFFLILAGLTRSSQRSSCSSPNTILYVHTVVNFWNFFYFCDFNIIISHV